MTTLGDAELEKVVWQAYKSWSDDPDRGKYPEKTLVAHTIKALKQIRDARLVGPSRMDMVEAKTEHQRLHRELDRHSVHESWYACYDWFSEQLRLEPAETKAPTDIWAVINKGFQLLFKEEFLARKYLMDNATTSNGLEIIKIPLICEQLPLDDVTDKPQKHYKSVQDVTAPISDEELDSLSTEYDNAREEEHFEQDQWLGYQDGWRAAERHHGIKGDE